MADTLSPVESRPAASAGKKPARRRQAAPGARKRATPRAKSRRSHARRGGSGTETLDRLLARLAAQASRAGSRILSLSEEGVVGARRTFGKASAASKKTMGRIAKQWQTMDSRRRVQIITALLGALAAASAPIVRKKLQKR